MFKLQCNKKRIIDYPNIWGHTKEIYQLDGIKDTVDFHHITWHYMVIINYQNGVIKDIVDVMASHGKYFLKNCRIDNLHFK